MSANKDKVSELVTLIDSVLVEFEDLKKSSKFDASEIKMEGPGEEMSGHPANGKLGKEEDDEEDKKKKEEEKKKAEKEAAEKDMKKEEDKDEDKEDDKKKKEDKEEDKEEEKAYKSLKIENDLMKSEISGRFSTLEKSIAAINEALEKLSKSPVESKGFAFNFAPLRKNDEEVKTLSKSDVVSQLLNLKKSGTFVDSTDVIKAESGMELESLVSRYNLKK